MRLLDLRITSTGFAWLREQQDDTPCVLTYTHVGTDIACDYQCTIETYVLALAGNIHSKILGKHILYMPALAGTNEEHLEG